LRSENNLKIIHKKFFRVKNSFYICFINQLKTLTMKKLVLIRFGQVRPIPAVTEALMPHMLPGAVALPFPGAVVPIFDTNSEVDVVAKGIRATGVNFILYEASQDGTMPADIVINAAKVATGATQPTAEPTLDEVIAKMREHGRDSLTAREIQILENGLS
jgi:hypothetical protein